MFILTALQFPVRNVIGDRSNDYRAKTSVDCKIVRFVEFSNQYPF